MYTNKFKVDVSDSMIKYPAECINFNNKYIKLTTYIDKNCEHCHPVNSQFSVMVRIGVI